MNRITRGERGAGRRAQCQGCEEPACVADCPAQIDIPGVLRRMEAGNFTGAARELHLRSPFGGLCGVACPAEQLCERHCYRRSFAGQPVRIAELLRWVVGSAGSAGWPRQSRARGGPRVAVLGGNLAGLTCACYLALAGCAVDVLDCHDRAPAGLDAAQGELDAVLSLGVRFSRGQQPSPVDQKQYAAMYLASDEWAGQVAGLADTPDGRLFPWRRRGHPAAGRSGGRGPARWHLRYPPMHKRIQARTAAPQCLVRSDFAQTCLALASLSQGSESARHAKSNPTGHSG